MERAFVVTMTPAKVSLTSQMTKPLSWAAAQGRGSVCPFKAAWWDSSIRYSYAFCAAFDLFERMNIVATRMIRPRIRLIQTFFTKPAMM